MHAARCRTANHGQRLARGLSPLINSVDNTHKAAIFADLGRRTNSLTGGTSISSYSPNSFSKPTPDHFSWEIVTVLTPRNWRLANCRRSSVPWPFRSRVSAKGVPLAIDRFWGYLSIRYSGCWQPCRARAKSRGFPAIWRLTRNRNRSRAGWGRRR